MSVQLQKHYFNVDEYYRMAQAGVFSEDDRVELIEGEVVEMSPIGSTHQGCVDELSSLITGKLAGSVIVRVQGPIHIDEYSEPQQDIALLKPRPDFYRRSHPTPSDVLLVIEVADTSVEYDRGVKLPLYARAGIPEAWLIALPKDVIEVHSEPKNGKYQKVRRLKRGKVLTSATINSLTLKADDILG
jgi:Uma2 family endonuclease